MAATVDLGPKRAWTPHYQPPPEAAMQDLLAPYVVGQQGGGGHSAFPETKLNGSRLRRGRGARMICPVCTQEANTYMST